MQQPTYLMLQDSNCGSMDVELFRHAKAVADRIEECFDRGWGQCYRDDIIVKSKAILMDLFHAKIALEPHGRGWPAENQTKAIVETVADELRRRGYLVDPDTYETSRVSSVQQPTTRA